MMETKERTIVQGDGGRFGSARIAVPDNTHDFDPFLLYGPGYRDAEPSYCLVLGLYSWAFLHFSYHLSFGAG